MRALRSVLFWSHLVAGVVAGGIIFVMSTTGVALTYQRQLQRWADVRELTVVRPEGALPLPADSLLRLLAAGGTTPTAVLWRVDPEAPVEVNRGRAGRAYVDPYTGAVLGEGNATVRRLFSEVTEWHRWLGQSGEGRAAGRAVTGAANLAFLVLVLTGAWLWWPRRATWAAMRNVLWLRRGLRAKAREFNWHHVLGVWCFVPLLVVVASGVVISYPWAGALVYRAVGETPPQSAGAASRSAEGPQRNRAERDGRAPAVHVPSLRDPLTLASTYVPAWTSVSLAWPKSAQAPLVYTIDAGTGGELQKRGTLTVPQLEAGAPATAARDSVTWVPFAAQTAGRRARSWLRFLHTGEALGLPGQTIAGLVSLAAAMLVYTGLALSLRRLFAWRLRRGRRSGPTAPTTAPPAADPALVP